MTDGASEQLQNGEVTFSRAAETADSSVWDFGAVLREADPSWLDGVEFDR